MTSGTKAQVRRSLIVMSGLVFLDVRAFGKRNLFQVIETSLSYDLNKFINLNVYYSHIFGGGIVRSIFAGDQADFGYVEVLFKL